MRNYKFRGKDLTNGMWYYGYYIKTKEESKIITDDGFVLIKPETVGQFTNLLDKDGKEIYEGDIVKDINDELHQIKWLHSGWGLQRLADGDRCGWCVVPGYDKEREFLKVIGNIHDNKELLKEKNE